MKTLDLLMATHALSHDVALLAIDKDFALMREAGVPFVLA